jgi:hypothetical protein
LKRDQHYNILAKFVNYGQKSLITMAPGDDSDVDIDLKIKKSSLFRSLLCSSFDTILMSEVTPTFAEEANLNQLSPATITVYNQ